MHTLVVVIVRLLTKNGPCQTNLRDKPQTFRLSGTTFVKMVMHTISEPVYSYPTVAQQNSQAFFSPAFLKVKVDVQASL